GPMRKLVWLAVVAISLAVPAAATADVAHVGYPSSIASTGDSITRAFNTCSFPFVDCPQNSWSTGSSSAVISHYRRILAANAAISGRNYNDARTGAKMAGLNGQVGSAVAQRRLRDRADGSKRRVHVERLDDDSDRDACCSASNRAADAQPRTP